MKQRMHDTDCFYAVNEHIKQRIAIYTPEFECSHSHSTQRKRAGIKPWHSYIQPVGFVRHSWINAPKKQRPAKQNAHAERKIWAPHWEEVIRTLTWYFVAATSGGFRIHSRHETTSRLCLGTYSNLCKTIRNDGYHRQERPHLSCCARLRLQAPVFGVLRSLTPARGSAPETLGELGPQTC